MKKHVFRWILISFLGLIVAFLSVTLINHYTYKVDAVEATHENDTGLVQAYGRGLYDENGNEIIFRGVNLGGWFCSEGWLEPYAISEAVIEEQDGEMRPVYKTVNYFGDTLIDKFSQDEVKRAIESNTNISLENRNVEDVLDSFYDNWISESDIENIGSMGLNQIRIPIGWRMILNYDETNDIYSVKTNAELDESMYYFDRCLDWVNAYNLDHPQDKIYVVLDLHSCPLSQNGYEHGGTIEWIEGTAGKKCAHLWQSEKAIEATIKVWETLSDRYNVSEYANTICMYDIMNEPRNTTGVTDKVCWDVFDRIYDALREKNDKHVIIMEGCWGFDRLPNPAKYGWTQVCYSYHWYNFSPINKTDFDYDLYYSYQDLSNIGRNYNVPVYIGEFSFFEYSGSNDEETLELTNSRWTKGLDLFESRHYSWCLWTYKKVVNGWWNDTWGIYNIKATLTRGGTYDVRVDLSSATMTEIEDAFSASKIGTTSANCKASCMYTIIKNYCLGKKA